MKKTFLVLLSVLSILSLFAGKYILFNDGDRMLFVDIEQFPVISIEDNSLILGNKVTNYSSDSIEMELTNEKEQEKLDRIDYLVNRGYIVKGEAGNEYFGDNSVRNLTSFKVKEIKRAAFTEDFYKFLESNNSFFDLSRWLNNFANAIPVELD